MEIGSERSGGDRLEIGWRSGGDWVEIGWRAGVCHVEGTGWRHVCWRANGVYLLRKPPSPLSQADAFEQWAPRWRRAGAAMARFSVAGAALAASATALAEETLERLAWPPEEEGGGEQRERHHVRACERSQRELRPDDGEDEPGERGPFGVELERGRAERSARLAALT